MNRSHVWNRAIGSSLLIASLIFTAPAFAAPPLPPLCPYTAAPGSAITGNCLLANPIAPLLPATQPKFVNALPQPIFYVPDQSDGVFDYYEVFSRGADVSLAAPPPFGVGSLTPAVPDSMDTWGATLTPSVKTIWLGLVDPLVPANKLYTEMWGYGQRNAPTGTYDLNNVSTYPAMSFRATKGKPVKVMWINSLPDQHMFCKFPLNSSYPCAIDRTLMGIRGPVDAFGSEQQPDNAMVVHLHGGEIPPDSDGFAELWFGNAASAAARRAPVAAAGDYQNIDPHLIATPLVGTNAILKASLFPPYNGNSTPTGDVNKDGSAKPFAPVLGSLIRPTGDSMIYNYPMVQEAATIWYHDHALAKTRINVAAGPAGYFYIQDPLVDTTLWGAMPDAATGYYFGDCTNGGILANKCRDIPIVLQDRAFNADGSINYPNGLGQIAKNKINPLTPGPNPAVHPQWVPEYFGDHAVVNGITWPVLQVEPKAYRFRFLDGSNARCYTLSLTAAPAAARVPGRPPAPAAPLPINLIASDQGYLPAPKTVTVFTMCPGERYEAVIDFSGATVGTIYNLTNTAGAPFPAGITPQTPGSPDAFLASMMQFKVVAGTATAWVPPARWADKVQASVIDRITALTTDPAYPEPPRGGVVGAPPVPAVTPANQYVYVLNEILDPLSKAPLRVQIDGKAFEDPVTEMPVKGSIQYWDIVNTTVDAHPMHLHLVQFKVIGRWTLDINKYMKAAITPDPLIPNGILVNKAVNPMAFAMGPMRAPDFGEEGFKDTAKSMPGEVLRIVARWDGGWADAPSTPGTPFYQPVTAGPYVWHCHIVDHEDNEMMRPTLVVKP